MTEQSKTTPTDGDVAQFLTAVTPARRQADARTLDKVFRQATGFAPVLWASGIVGYGTYDYTYATGHSGTSLATGFAPRKTQMVIYIMPGYGDFGAILADLGPHKRGKSCLYLGALAKIDLAVLDRLIRAGLDDLARRWPVHPT